MFADDDDGGYADDDTMTGVMIIVMLAMMKPCRQPVTSSSQKLYSELFCNFFFNKKSTKNKTTKNSRC